MNKNIGLIDVDGHNGYPNLALMKLSRYHKEQGDSVEWALPFTHYDIIYMSKIFSFTPDFQMDFYTADKIVKGGTGYDYSTELPLEIDRTQPDYSLYPSIDKKTAYGFLTRGCPNKCKWCVVPKKEGLIHPYMDIDEIMIEGRNHAVLMDNNILACDYGMKQLEKIAERRYIVDFNQGLDARLITPDIAKLLASIRWEREIRFGCDTPKQIEECDKAVELLDRFGFKGMYFFYTIIMEFEESFKRINHWRENKRTIVQAQPYRELNNPRQVIPQWQKDMAHWANRKELYKTTTFEAFEPRKGFKCKKYFDEQDLRK